MRRWGALAAALLVMAMPRFAFALSVDAGGQVKASAQGIRYDSEDVRQSLDSSDDLESSAALRLTSRTSVTGVLTFDVDYELIREGGAATKRRSDLAEAGLALSTIRDVDKYRLFDLTGTLDESSYHHTIHRLDRLSLNWEVGNADIRVGRQALTWGGGLLFNPMDLVNPFSPIDTLRDYKAGDDLGSLRYTTEQGHEIQAIGRPGRDGETRKITSAASTVASKMHGMYGELEGDIFIARHRDQGMSGVGVAGYAGDAAWRFDFIASEEDGGTLSSVANMDLSWVAWQKNWYGFVELYYNGFGTSDYAEALADPPTLERLDRGEVFVLGKGYLATSLQMEAHPLVNLVLVTITNVGDPSGLLQPSLVWDARDNLRLDAVALIPWGGSETEYGGFSLPGGRKAVPAREIILRATCFF